MEEDILESRDIIGDAVEQESTNKRNDNSHDVVEGHQEWVPALQLISRSKNDLTYL